MNVLRSLIPAPLKPAVRRAKLAMRSLRTVAHDAPINAKCEATIVVIKPVLLTEAGRPFAVHLSITNHTPAAISAEGTHPVGIQIHWASYAGEPCRAPDVFLPLPQTIWPGELLNHVFTLIAPESLGDYIADFALMQKGGPRFEQVGPRAKLDVPVTTPLDAEFNYHDIYANADLNTNFWSASGPPSRAEFERLVPIKLKLLTDQGLTPDGKILDVGCGTGLLATAAERFLSDRGLFWGTDLAKEAVEFCKSKYMRPNFHFAVNGMTTIPVSGVLFDAITYFSVFTHTYVEETALLLAESKRLLAPKGFIFADCFTSPLVERSIGSRYATEVNRDLLLRLAAVAGLKAELVMDSPWKGQARREFFKFTHI
jgi:ubiquinone/menaquinone biosynthesis C-methylase UbiE